MLMIDSEFFHGGIVIVPKVVDYLVNGGVDFVHWLIGLFVDEATNELVKLVMGDAVVANWLPR